MDKHTIYMDQNVSWQSSPDWCQSIACETHDPQTIEPSLQN